MAELKDQRCDACGASAGEMHRDICFSPEVRVGSATDVMRCRGWDLAKEYAEPALPMRSRCVPHFQTADGRLVGENGPEAILPLNRARDGKLGIAAHDAKKGQTVTITVSDRRIMEPLAVSATDKRIRKLIAESVRSMLFPKKTKPLTPADEGVHRAMAAMSNSTWKRANEL